MTISVFHIDSSDYTSYASVDEADKYLRPDPRWTAWSDLQLEQKQVNLVAATRLVDQAGEYSGSKVDGNQPAAFPRNNLACSGNQVNTPLPVDIVNATILLAGTLAVTPIDPADTGAPGQFREIVAGPVEISYFHTARTDLPPDALTPEPLADQVLKCYFSQASNARPILGLTTGCPTKSSFKDPHRFDTF